jgi:pimeloyl-ACP methyl ester carboxylesterase
LFEKILNLNRPNGLDIMTKEVKKKTPLLLRAIQWTFPKVEKIAPTLAEKWAWKLFFTPFRFKAPVKEMEAGDKANKFTFEAEGYVIQGYEWGTGDSTIMLMHGWSGRATQWRSFIKPLNDSGYKVVAIDGPAHGKSSGEMTDIIRFSEVLKVVFTKYPEMDTMITHSFGGATSMVAVQNGLPLKRLVNIGTPTDGDFIISDFLRRINGSPQSGDRFKQHIIDDFGRRFDEFSVKETIKYADDLDILMIHDRSDKEVSVQHSIDLHEDNPTTELFITEGLGHMRILRDPKVISRAIDFVKEGVAVL